VKLLEMYNYAIQQETIKTGFIESAITRSVNETIDQFTKISFSFFARSGLKAGDFINITIPDPYRFETGMFSSNTSSPNPTIEPEFYSGNASVLNIQGPIYGMRGLLGVSEIDKNNRVITLRRCDVSESLGESLDVPITFTLGPLRNRGYGSVNYRETEIAAANFTVNVFDSSNNLIETTNVSSPPIRPAWMGMTAEFSTNKSATLATLNLKFQLFYRMLAKDEFFVFLPRRFSVDKELLAVRVSYQSATGASVHLPSVNFELERVLDPLTSDMQRVTVRIGANAALDRGLNISISIENIFTPVGGQRAKDDIVLSTASYGCSSSTQGMSWSTSIPVSPICMFVNYLHPRSTNPILSFPNLQYGP
jgi:hypothetical protein